MNLILISSEPIRKKWTFQYHQIEKKLAKLKRDWNIFEDEAQAQYQQWYHQNFAEQLSKLAQNGEEIHELRTTLSAVHAHIEVNRLSKKAAFEYVMDAIKNKKKAAISLDEAYDTMKIADEIISIIKKNNS